MSEALAQLETPEAPTVTAKPEAPPEPDQAVTVAYVHEDNVCYSWHHSLIELIGHDMSNHGRLMQGGWVAMRCGTDGLVEARNKSVLAFLEERKGDWLFWIDTDAGFPPDIIDRLLEVADPQERPIVGALAFTYREEHADGLGGWRCRPTPTIFDWQNLGDQMGFTVRWGYPENTVVRCAGTGSHAILIHRSALLKIQEKYGNAWYDRIDNTTLGKAVSEDLSFCMRANVVGLPIYVHTGVQTSHQKTIWVGQDDYYAQNDAPPATLPTAVLVPAIRTTNAERFMATLHASTGMAQVYAIANREEAGEAEIWKSYGAVIVWTDGFTFAERMNAGFKATTEPLVFVTGDDVRFRAAWLDQAQSVMARGFGIVGTNDLGNPRVVSGEHATHFLVSRAYVDAYGGSWDGPGVLAHEGYRHWYVDDEIVSAAKMRNQWAMAIDSHVEHLHPQWGKGRVDAIYELGVRSTGDDRALFEKRLSAQGGTIQ